GTSGWDASSASAKRAVLTDAHVLDIATLALRCQDAVGEDYAPQDVEWAYDSHRYWILQSRPITIFRDVMPEALQGQPTIWSTANLKEVLPPVYTPYAWSTVRLSMNTMMEGVLKRSGYDVPPGMRWIRLYQGHPFFNLSLIQWTFYDAYGVGPGRTNQMMGGQQPSIQLPPGQVYSGAVGRRRLRRLLHQVLDSRRVFEEVPAASEAMRRKADAFGAFDLTDFDDEQLQDELWRLSGVMSSFMVEFMRANTQASTWLDALFQTLEWLLPDRGRGLATRLLAGTGDIASAEQGYLLVDIARQAAGEPKARAFFLESTQPQRWQEELDGTKTGAAFASFMREFGHRGVEELEFANSRWQEDPTYIVETVREHILSGLEAPPDPHATRRAAEEELRRSLRLHPARPLVRWILGQARKASALRENTKSVLVYTMLPFRRAAKVISRRLVERNVLPAPEDLYFITINDLEAILRGLWDGRGLDRLVTDRRALYARQRVLRVPDVLLDDTPVAQVSAMRVVSAQDGASSGHIFDGIGVAAGRADGAARVIHNPREGHRLQKGEVLVAPTTDPGWTPLFLRASALVMETGGYLSHGAIVAREYGIPAVANVPGVLDEVHDGDQLTVDGDRGQVLRKSCVT
ncbi:MAG TPA: PEP-utilizing enzyme, partial [Chloroflexota bacterium]|nr:PEP-utilizing enzyme [Chloroflexota bacterium]